MPPLLHLEWFDASLDVLQLPLKPLKPLDLHGKLSLPPCSKRIQAISETLNGKWLLEIAIASLWLVCLFLFFDSFGFIGECSFFGI